MRIGRLAAGKTEPANAGHRVTGKTQSQHSVKGKPSERAGRKVMGAKAERPCSPDCRNFTIQIYFKENEMMAKKRVLSWLVAASLALSLLPTAVLAVDETETKTLSEQILEPLEDKNVDPANKAADNLYDATYDALNPGSEKLSEGEHRTHGDIITEVTDESGEKTDKVNGSVLTEAENAKGALDDAQGKINAANEAKTEAGAATSAAQGAVTDAKSAIESAADAISDADQAKSDAVTAANAASAAAGEAANELTTDNAKLSDVEDALNVETEDGEKKAVTDIITEQKEIAETAASDAAAAAANGDVEGAAAARDTAEAAVNAANNAYDKAQSQFVDAVKNILGEEAFNAVEAPADDASDETKAAYNQALVAAAQAALRTKYGKYNDTIGAGNTAIDTANGKVDEANTAIGTANTAIGTANTAIDTANTAIDTANGKVGEANVAVNGANEKATDAVKKLSAAKAALEEANALKETAIAARTQVETYITLLDTTKENPEAVEALKQADRDLTAAQTDAAAKKSVADKMEPEDSTAKTSGERIERDSEIATTSNSPTIKQAAKKIQQQIDILNSPTATPEEKKTAEANIFDNHFWGENYVFYTKSPYQIIVDDWRGHGSDTGAALERLLQNLNVLKSEIVEREAQKVYDSAETALKDSLKDAPDKDVIAAVKALGEFKDANEALNKYEQAAKTAQSNVNMAIRTYNQAKGAVESALKELTTNDEAKQLISQTKLASLIRFGTISEIEKVSEDLKNALVKDSDVTALLDKLDTALADLATAKEDKDAAEKAKEDADQAVQDAEEEAERRRQELEEITGTPDTGDTADDDDTAATIEDGIVPLALMPTRGELMNYLYVRAGSPAAQAPTFTDVPADHAFAAAIGWAQANGIAVAYEDGTFDPDNFVIAADLTAFLTRYADFAGMTMPALPAMAGLEDDAIVENADEILAEFFGD